MSRSGRGEPGRRPEARPVGVDVLDVAQDLGEIDGKGSPEVGFDGPEEVRNTRSLRAEAGVSGHLLAEGCPGGLEAVPKIVRLGAGDAGANRRTNRADRPSRRDGRG